MEKSFDQLTQFNSNPNSNPNSNINPNVKYYPAYTINPESIYGSGIVLPNKNISTNTATSVITNSFPVKKKISPPVFHSGVSVKPQDTNGYKLIKNTENRLMPNNLINR